MKKPRPVGKPFDPGRQLASLRFSPCGKQLVAGDHEGGIQRWDASGDALKPLPALKGHSGWVQALAFHPKGGWFYSADSWGRLSCWSLDGKSLWTVPQAHDGWVRKVVVSPDGMKVATCGRDGCMRLWGAEKGERLRQHSHGEDLLALAFGPDSLVFGDLRGVIVQQDAAGKELRRHDAKAMYKLHRIQEVGGVRVLLFDPTGKTLMAGGCQPTTGGFVQGTPLLIAFEAATGKATQSLSLGKANEGFILDAAWHAGGVLAVTSGQPGVGSLLWHKPGEAAPAFKLTVPNPHSLALHEPSGRVMVAATKGNGGNGRGTGKEYKLNPSPLYAWKLEG